MANLNAMSDNRALPDQERASQQSISDNLSANTSPRSTELVELLYLLKLGVKTNLRWIGRTRPDIDAARKTSARLCEYVDRLEILIASANRG